MVCGVWDNRKAVDRSRALGAKSFKGKRVACLKCLKDGMSMIEFRFHKQTCGGKGETY